MKNLDLTLCTHNINTEGGSLARQSPQRKFIPYIMEIVKGEKDKTTVKMKEYHPHVQTIVHLSNL